MKNTLILGLALLLLAGAGCRTRYDITLTSGTKIRGVSKPVLDRQSGYYIFRDAAGRTNAVLSMRVSVIEPQRPGASDGDLPGEFPGARKSKKK